MALPGRSPVTIEHHQRKESFVPELTVIAEQLVAPVPGGAGRYTRELLGALVETAPSGWEISTVIARGGDPRLAQVDGVVGPRVLPLGRRGLSSAWQYGLPPRVRADSVHAMTPLAPPVRADTGLVVTVHDTVPFSHPETLTPRGARWHRAAISRATRTADAIVVPTRTVADDLASRVPLASEPAVVAEGVSGLPQPDSEQEARVAKRLGLPRDYILAVGTIEPRKGYQHLISALAADCAPDADLLIVGSRGWGDIDPARIAADHGVADRVTELGALSDLELSVLLRRAGVLAAPSLAEGFGLPLLEAMKAGVPVVHSDAPAFLEVVGGAGVVVRRADVPGFARALRAILSDSHLRTEKITAGKRRIEQFTWRSAAWRVWELHTAAIERRVK